jgi:hypothetical protein
MLERTVALLFVISRLFLHPVHSNLLLGRELVEISQCLLDAPGVPTGFAGFRLRNTSDYPHKQMDLIGRLSPAENIETSNEPRYCKV